MIELNMSGRLGNQMFRYATARWYMEKTKDFDLYLICNNLVKRGFYNQLDDFNIMNYKVIEKKDLSIKQHLLLGYIGVYVKTISKVCKNNKSCKIDELKNKYQKMLNKNGIYNMDNSYHKLDISKEKKVFFNGNFESSKYFEEIKSIILKEFTPKHEKLEKNKKLYSVIENTNSVCISIRRGDFLSKDNINAHYVCTPEYFKEAIEVMKKEIDNPTFIIFSDDIEWVKNNMEFPPNSYYEDGDDPVWEKLRLMYSCKNFIISNSTFSWWTQYLSRNEKKVVVAPSRWKNTINNKDIFDKNWILVNV